MSVNVINFVAPGMVLLTKAVVLAKEFKYQNKLLPCRGIASHKGNL